MQNAVFSRFRIARPAWIAFLAVGAALGGCAQTGSDDSQAFNDWLKAAPRRIAVTAETHETPSNLVRLETSTVAEGAGKGAAGGAAIGAGSVLGVLVASPPVGWLLLAFPPTWAVIGGAGVAGAAIGGTAGAATADPIVETKAISTVPGGAALLSDVATPHDYEIGLRDTVVTELRARARHKSEAIEAAQGDLRDALEGRADLDGILAVNIDSLSLVLDKGDETAADPEAALYLVARSHARVRIDGQTATVAPKRYSYETARYRLSEWRSEGGRRLVAQITRASESLARQIVQDYIDGEVTAWLSSASGSTDAAAATMSAAADATLRADEGRAGGLDGYWTASDGAWNLELHIVGDRYRLTGQCMEVQADARGRMDADGHISATLPIVGSYRVFAAGTLERFRVLGRHPICGQTTVAFARVGDQARLE